ncbi:hypothetical protein ACFP2T_04295 [Plantactinospora solaniradicis]|uniref:DUF3592 domain-containing protein n=1 Tax=Plantactinospora solaniradicis TaxID=1723736 RepID=A0ABW1K273_9ACTN
MPVLISSLILGLVSILAALWQVRQGHQLTRKLNSGTARALRCWLRGWSEPYPGALHPGRLVAVDGEPVRFECRTGTVRRLLLPAGGLRVMQAREVTDADRLMTLAPSQANQFTLLICRDATGVRVDVAVPVAAASAAETFLLGTATATGPGSATVPRPVGPVRRYVGRWTAAVLLISVVMVGSNIWTWQDAERITGTVSSSLPAGDQGYLCSVQWRDPWTSETRYSTIDCPATRPENGERIEAVARPGRDLATTGDPYLGLLFAGIVAFMAFPQVVRRLALHLRGRSVLRQQRGAQPQTSAWRSSPRLEIGELDPESVGEAVTVRAQLEGWHYRVGRWRARHTVRSDSPRPWWRIRFLRRTVLTPTSLGIIAFVGLALGLVFGIPLWQNMAAQAGGPVREVTATVEPRTDSTRIPLLPVGVSVSFTGPDGLVETTVMADEPLPAHSLVPVEYLVGDPGRARIVGDHDRLTEAGTAAAVLAVLAAVAWFAGWILAVRRARRLGAALADPDPARMRYVLVMDPRGRLTALLYPGYGRPEQPVMSQPLAVALPDGLSLSGVADLYDASPHGQLLVVDDLVLWPSGPGEQATPEATLDVVNGRR